ncbi:NAD(P)H:quinone oxidoreductase [Crossiella sp. SN42]|uniref:NAD(P)H:quinone oxidoreductase n=1 Tax=Crossiella sp. SN42 TaxID=2944808 RepID=UPI00207C325B|nr:NAD(P)H:quinone oxidoreductase [Crossiella sp. SN42]MCO1576984.1 NAD(P)H:quinone oxidoreductase [Crossiella sp. SN42]
MSQPKVAVIYYSSTGSVHALAQSIAEGASGAGAEVRVLKVPELAPAEAIASNPAWQAHAEATKDVPVATAADVEWADAVIFGTPTRFGNVASQLKQFLDTLSGLWAQGALADKVYSGFVSTATQHGGRESTLLALYNTVHHFGGILVTPGYTDPIQFATGTPYGASHADAQGQNPISEDTHASARFQGKRVAELTARFLKNA